MCPTMPSRRRGEPARTRLAAVAAALAIALAAGAAARQEGATASYLERLGLVDLLAIDLERQVFGGGSLPEARNRAVERLAGIYPDLLERATDPAVRADLERRIDRLLARHPPEEPGELRLALLRARYRSAARVAEDDRVALATPEAIAQARTILEEIARDLPSLRSTLEAKARGLDRRGENAPVLQAERMVDLADRLRVKVAQTLLLEGWSRYYLLRMPRDGEEDAREAESGLKAADQAFRRIVDTGEAYPQAKDVSLDLRDEETFAEAILGMALCRSRQGSPATAREWLDLLEVPEAAESTRRQLPAWRLALAIDERNWAEARERLASLAASAETPVPWLRLAAVGGLRERDRDPEAATLAREALAALAARRELSAVVDLARRFGRGSFGEAGFAARYVAGVLLDEEARVARAAGDEETALARFGAAADAFELALLERDAAAFAASLAGCRSAGARCRFERGEFAAALAGFRGVADAAAAAGDADEGADWMTIVSLDRLIAGGAEPDGTSKGPPGSRAELRTELASRIDAFLDRHPSSPNVPALLGIRLAAEGVPDRADIDRLLGASGDGPEAIAARTEAALALYRLFRVLHDGNAAAGESRLEVGQAFLKALTTLPSRDGLPAGQVVLVRQAAEVALAEEVRDLEAGARAIATLEARARDPRENGSAALAAEVAMRWVQLEALRGDWPEAVRRLGLVLADPAADSARREFARRALFRAAAARFRDGPPTAADRGTLRSATIASGESILANAAESAGSISAALGDAGIEGVAALTLAAVRESLASVPPDERLFARMRPVAEALLERRPKDAVVLETVADLSLAAGDRGRGIEALRVLVAGSPVGSERWYRAKTILIETLAETDPARARDVLAQHVALQPTYGPSPWAERLRAVEARLAARPGGVP